MKIAVSSTGKDLDSLIYHGLGGSPYFIIVEIKNNAFTKIGVIENHYAKTHKEHQRSGAGAFAARTLYEKGVKTLIAIHVGDRAKNLLKTYNIDIYYAKGCRTVKEALQKFLEDKFHKTKS